MLGLRQAVCLESRVGGTDGIDIDAELLGEVAHGREPSARRDIDFDTGDTVGACSGNWQVNGGTGDYRRLKGTGTFTETQNLNSQSVGTGSITLLGTMHTD